MNRNLIFACLRSGRVYNGGGMNQRADSLDWVRKENDLPMGLAGGLVAHGESDLLNQITHPHPQGFGNPHQGINARRFLPPFNLPHINWMQVGLFSQFFLAQPGAFSELANGFADYFMMSQRFAHACSGKQEAGEINTVHSTLFYSCLPRQKG